MNVHTICSEEKVCPSTFTKKKKKEEVGGSS